MTIRDEGKGVVFLLSAIQDHILIYWVINPQ